MASIGLVIVAGTIIGTILERSGAALKMAEVVLGWVGIKRSPLAEYYRLYYQYSSILRLRICDFDSFK